MWRIGRKGRGVVVAAGMMVGATVLAGASPSATAEGPLTVTEAFGTLRLNVAGGGATVTFTPAPGVEALDTQAFVASGKCGATPGSTLLGFTAIGGAFGLGLNVSDIGVRTRNTCATDSGRISALTESLTIALGSSIPANVSIARAELDIEGKKNADLSVVLGTTTLPLIDLSRASSDNGPDAGVGDNNRVLLAPAVGFRAMTLTAIGLGAEVALNGGGDGTFAQYDAADLIKEGTLGDALGTADTIFELVATKSFEDVLPCGETRFASVIGGSAESATISLPIEPNQPCEAIPITFKILDEGVLLDKSLLGQDLDIEVTIVWSEQDATTPLPTRRISLVPPFAEGTFEDVAWCTGQDANGDWTHPADTPWCLINDVAVQQANGQVQQTQIYDGAGDPMWR